MLAQRVSLLSQEVAARLLADCEVIGKMLRNLIRSLQAKADA